MPMTRTTLARIRLRLWLKSMPLSYEEPQSAGRDEPEQQQRDAAHHRRRDRADSSAELRDESADEEREGARPPEDLRRVDLGDRHDADVLGVGRRRRTADAPRRLAVAMPSPNSDSGSIGVKFLPVISLMTSRWPMCSMMTTSATGAMIRMASSSNTGNVSVGRPIHGAALMPLKSVSPSGIDTMKPDDDAHKDRESSSRKPLK